MRTFLLLAILSLILPTIAFAQPPIVTYNVTVMQNASPQQCNNWKSDVGPEDNPVAYTVVAGDDTDFTGPGVRSCVNCRVNSSTQDCVCKTCYDYFN